MPNKLSTEKVNIRYKNSDLFLLEDYINDRTKHKTKCLRCNFEWNMKPNDVFNGHKCPSCAQVKRLTYDEVKERYNKLNIELLTDSYTNIRQKLQLKCKICGHIWFSTMMNTDKGRGCPFCATERRKNTNIEKYGVDVPCKNPEIALKAAKNSNNIYIVNHWKDNREIVCKASYEYKVVLNFNKEKEEYQKNIPFKMPDGRVYFVDFYLPQRNTYIEVKGRWYGDAKEKWDWFHKEHPNSELWDKDKLKELRILQ